MGETNRKQRRMFRAINRTRPLDHVDKVASTKVAFEEAVKDNLAGKVIENFIAGLAALPFRRRLEFCYNLLFRNKG